MLALLTMVALAQASGTPPALPGANLAPIDALLARTIWPELYQDLFGQPFDLLAFGAAYPFDRVFDDAEPSTYYGRNQHGQPYAAHVVAIYPLSSGNFADNLTFWGADVDVQSDLTLRRTRGVVITNTVQDVPISFFVPGGWFDHYPPVGAGHDCSPPAIPPDYCDIVPDCESGALKYLDSFCAKQVGENYRIACETAWGLYDADMEFADSTYQNCSDQAFGVYAVCVAAAGASALIPPTFGFNTIVVMLSCTGYLNTSLAACDQAYHAATSLAAQRRDTLLKAAKATYDNALQSCCKDCPPITGKPPKQQPQKGPKRP